MTRHATPSGHSSLAEPLGPADLILCDFDGTITRVDVGVAVIDALDDPRGWELEMRWRRGEIDSRECLAGQWGLVNWSADKLLDFLDSLELDEGFRDLWELVRRREARLVVVSDGLDLYLDHIMERLGLAVCEGERVLSSPFGNCVPRFVNHAYLCGGRVHIEFPHSSPLCDQCANCKLAHLMDLRPHFRRVIYIGDGYSDQCPAKYADLVFAKDHLAEILASQRVAFIPFAELSEVVQMLEGKRAEAGYEVIDHPADYAVRAWAPDLAALIEAAGRAMLSLVADTKGLKPSAHHSLTVQGDSREQLIHHALRELLYLFEDGELPVELSASVDEERLAAELQVGTVPVSAARDRLLGEIKAVTYHNLAVREETGLLVTELVFDV